MSTPKPIGEVIDSLYELRSQRLDVEQRVKDMKAEEAKLREEIIGQLDELQIKSGRGSKGTATVTYTQVAKVNDWQEVYKYIKENDMFELLTRRITNTLWAALEADGRHVPGTEAFDVVDLSLTKAKQS